MIGIRLQVGSGIPAALAQIRQIVSTELQAPEELVHELSRVAAAAGLPGADSWRPGSSTWTPVWKAITKVCVWWRTHLACGVRSFPIA